jgi:ABC-type dipeptide/oligopeptide/nickel transport system ATPase component
MGSEIGLIPQDPGSSFNPIRMLSAQFREAMAGHGMAYDEDRIDGLLKKIGLQQGKAVLGNRPFELSGGMNQRIAIAAAMLFEPRLLLCDEATSALDVTTAGAVVDELLKIRESRGTSILLVTHHLGIARRMADNIGIMKDGRLIEYGNTEKIFDAPENEYTRKLIRDVPRLKK